MRSLTALTTTAAIAFMGVANAQPQPSAPPSDVVTAAMPAASEFDQALTAYAAYHEDVTSLRAARINGDAALEQALERVARHNRDTLSHGFIAYGAMTAAQSPAFVEGVRSAAQHYGRDQVIWAITADPSYAMTLRGADDARRLILEIVHADSARIHSVGERYVEMASSMQNQAWARAVAPAQRERIQRVRTLGRPGSYTPTLAADVAPRLAATPLAYTPASDPTAFGGRQFWDGLRADGHVVETASAVAFTWDVNPTRASAVNNMTAIAALQALNASSDHASAISQLMGEQRTRDCVEMAQLQLYQCMSAARFRYENAYCLGQHGLADIGGCIAAIGVPVGQSLAPAASPVAATRND